jgi:hypothetical protein
MGAVDQILAKTQRKVVVDGIEFIVRRLSAGVVAEVIGSGVLGMGSADVPRREDGQLDLEKIDSVAVMKHAQDFLKVTMVKPRIGDVTDSDHDIISFSDLGDIALPLLSKITGDEDGEELFVHAPQAGPGQT